MTTLSVALNPSPFVAAEIRAQIGRQGTSARDVAARLGRPAMWLSRRIGKTADVDLTFEEVAQIAQALGIDTEGLIVDALRACRDSNPKPSDLYLAGICKRCGRALGCESDLSRQGHSDTKWMLAA